MNFGDALIALMNGQRVGRSPVADENGPWLIRVPSSRVTVEADRPLGIAAPELVGQQITYGSHIDLYQDGLLAPYSPDDEDLMATDWRILE